MNQQMHQSALIGTLFQLRKLIQHSSNTIQTSSAIKYRNDETIQFHLTLGFKIKKHTIFLI